jgi:hypothetical protein
MSPRRDENARNGMGGLLRTLSRRPVFCEQGEPDREPLMPLKGFPGVWQRSKKKKRVEAEGMS